MSSRRDAERDRDRASRTQQQQASARTNEYFVPKEGIDREVITADICRYLGNDALVRPGNYENPTTRQVQAGYFITAYRNLTTEMIADLKADSARWDAERRATVATRGHPTNVEYRASTTHQSRQYYGPTEAAPGAAAGYPPPAGAGAQPGGYDNGAAYQQGYNLPVQAYASAPGYASQDNYYVAGAEYGVGVPDPRSTARGQPVQPAGTIPRTGAMQYASSTPTYQAPADRNTFYSSQTPVSSAPGGHPSQQPTDPYYGRNAPPPGTYGDSPDYDNRAYQDTVFSQPPPISSSSSTTATSGSSRRDRRDDDRDRHGHRRR